MENLFVIFAPGCGGNHLANIISTSDRFVDRYSKDVYDTVGINAHPSKNNNYIPTESELLVIQHQSNVFCSHLAEYLISQQLTERYLHNRKYVLVELPPHTRNDFFNNRVTSLYPAYKNLYFMEETSVLYSIKYFSRLVNETDMTSITVNNIFTNDVAPLVDKLNSELGLNLSTNRVTDIHRSWLDKNKKFQ